MFDKSIFEFSYGSSNPIKSKLYCYAYYYYCYYCYGNNYADYYYTYGYYPNY